MNRPARQLHKAMGQQYPPLQSLVRQVRGWENGEHFPRDWRAAYAQAFGVNEGYLFGSPSAVPEEGDVLRREFLGASIVAGLGVTAAPGGHASGRRVGMETVEQLRRRVTRLRRLDDFLGGADTYHVYAGELAATTSLVNEASYSEPTGRALLGLVAEQAQQAGWAAFDAGWFDDARSLFKTSLSAATDASEMSLIGNALAYLAYQKVSTGQLGVEEADASCRVAGSTTPPAVRALLFERAAWAHALAGRSHEREVETALSNASEALEDRGDHPDPDWAVWVDWTELEIMTGRCWSALGRPLRAVPALEGALAQYADTHARDKALYLTWLADAYLDAGEVEQAADATSRAIDLSADVASVRPRQRVDQVLQRMKGKATVPVVTEPLERAATESSGRATPDTEQPAPDCGERNLRVLPRVPRSKMRLQLWVAVGCCPEELPLPALPEFALVPEHRHRRAEDLPRCCQSSLNSGSEKVHRNVLAVCCGRHLKVFGHGADPTYSAG
jgi:tetratricopeptide (TPR) repeat protein